MSGALYGHDGTQWLPVDVGEKGAQGLTRNPQVSVSEPAPRSDADLWADTGRRPTSTFDDGWIYPTPNSPVRNYNEQQGVTSYNDLSYRRFPSGLVVVRGLVILNTTSTVVICTLPPDYCPTASVMFLAMNGNQTGKRCHVNSAGQVTALATTASATYYSLDNIRFYAAGA